MTSTIEQTERKTVDMHVHIVGTGSGCSCCWLRVNGWHMPMAAFMVRHIGLSPKAFYGDFDRLYADLLVTLVRESSLGAAVILAHDQVYETDGRLMEGA